MTGASVPAGTSIAYVQTVLSGSTESWPATSPSATSSSRFPSSCSHGGPVAALGLLGVDEGSWLGLHDTAKATFPTGILRAAPVRVRVVPDGERIDAPAGSEA